MELTAAVKSWLIENAGVKSDASDEDFKAACMKALKEGKLTAAKFAELSTTKDVAPDQATASERVKNLLSSAVTAAMKPISDRLEKLESDAAKKSSDDSDSDDDGDADDDDGSGQQVDEAGIAKSITDIISKAFGSRRRKPAKPKSTDDDSDDPDDDSDPDDSDDDADDDEKSTKGSNKVDNVAIVKLFTGDSNISSKSYSSIRVKEATERYSDTKSALHHSSDSKHKHLRGKRVTTGYDGRDLDTLSDRDKAVGGSWFKLMVKSACQLAGKPVPRQWKMTEHDNQLVLCALHNYKFTGLIGYNEANDDSRARVNGRKLNDFERKAILDDSISGGLEAAPIVFDDAVITTPLLNGELFPLVNLINLPRGRRVEGWSIGNPTINSGVAEGTEISLFNTAAFIAAFDTTIFNAVGAIELGLDFEEDAPNNVLDIVVELYGQQFLTWLDNQIANGDGTTEPEGVFVASAGSSPASDNSTAGPPTLSDYEALLFGLQKQFRLPSDRERSVFISNEVSYRRSRGMKVDPASPSVDERRLLGMTHEDYITLGHPHKIQHDISNAKIAFVNLRYYRMYRRLGLNVRIERGGKELALRNSEVLVVRARFGGRITLGGALAVIDDAQS